MAAKKDPREARRASSSRRGGPGKRSPTSSSSRSPSSGRSPRRPAPRSSGRTIGKFSSGCAGRPRAGSGSRRRELHALSERPRLPVQYPNDVPERGRHIVDDADDDMADDWLVVDEAFHAVDEDIDILDRPVPDLEDGDARWQLSLAHQHDPVVIGCRTA